MQNFNARINNVKMANFTTPPQNLPTFKNPNLLMSDTEALNKLLTGDTPRPPPIPSEITSSSSQPAPVVPRPEKSQMPVQRPRGPPPADPNPATPAEEIHHNAPAAVIPPAANRDGAATSMPNRLNPPAPATPAREGETVDIYYDSESGDEGAHLGTGHVGISSAPGEGFELGDTAHDARTEPITPATAPTTPAPLTPATTRIANSPSGAGRTIDARLKTRAANFNNDGSLREANQAVVATHPPIVPVTDRITNNVGISNSLISSLYDKLTAAEKSKLSSRASYGFVRSADYPQLQTIFPSAFRRGKQIQTYRLTSGGNVYAYVYGGQSKPIYIGNWRESYRINKPPAYQPANPHSSGTRTRTAPVTTQLGNRGTRANQP
tara:strand:+ start:290 stop:1429 length:1140 start_codon:yes stop_codon:yes gene_type:complete